MSAELREEIISWIKLLVTAFLVALILKTFVFQIAIVDQLSMHPTLEPKNVLIVSKLTYRFNPPARGDIVVLRDELEDKLLVKRIIGLPEEKLEIKDHHVEINGVPLAKDWNTSENDSMGYSGGTVPQNSYFVMGDNRASSRDSRSDTLGAVSREDLQGKVVFRVWPLNQIGKVK